LHRTINAQDGETSISLNEIAPGLWQLCAIKRKSSKEFDVIFKAYLSEPGLVAVHGLTRKAINKLDKADSTP